MLNIQDLKSKVLLSNKIDKMKLNSVVAMIMKYMKTKYNQYVDEVKFDVRPETQLSYCECESLVFSKKGVGVVIKTMKKC